MEEHAQKHAEESPVDKNAIPEQHEQGVYDDSDSADATIKPDFDAEDTDEADEVFEDDNDEEEKA